MLRERDTVWETAVPRIASVAALCRSPVAAHALLCLTLLKGCHPAWPNEGHKWGNKHRGLLQPAEPVVISTRSQDVFRICTSRASGQLLPLVKKKTKRFSPALCLAQVPSGQSSPPHQTGAVPSDSMAGVWQSHGTMSVVMKRGGFVCAIRIRCRGCQAAGACKAPGPGPLGSKLNRNLSHLQLKNWDKKLKTNWSPYLLRRLHCSLPLSLIYPTVRASHSQCKSHCVPLGIITGFSCHVLDLQLIKEKCIQRSLFLAEPGQSWWAGRLNTGVTPGMALSGLKGCKAWRRVYHKHLFNLFSVTEDRLYTVYWEICEY